MTRFLYALPACDQEDVTPPEEDGPDIECLVCMDTGEYTPDNSTYRLPCSDCSRGDWTWRHELADDARRGK